jgi:hypothetical protein
MTRHLRHAPNFHGFAISIGAIITLAAAPVRANVTFNLIPDPGMPQFAIDGFSAAAGLWSSALADDLTINIQIGFSSLGSGIIGETSSEFIERSYPQVLQALETHRTSPDDVSSYAGLQSGLSYSRLINHTSDNPNGPNSAVPYVETMDRVGMTTANAKVLGLLAPDSSLDATIRFSSDFSFDFNHGTTIAPGEFDFVGAAAHEIGHALGFVSGVDDIDSFNGISPGGDFSSNLIDLFRYSESSLDAGVGYTDYTADNRDKFFSVNGGVTPIALFATGVNFGDGRQASHWKDDLGIGIMDPTAGPGERLDISATDLLAFDVMGYTLVPEPGTGVFFGPGLLFVLVRSRRRQPE